MKITAVSVKRKIATATLVAAMVVLGMYGLFNLPISLLPDLEYPVVKVFIRWDGATPGEIERNIAEPLERQIATIDNLDYIESTCTEGSYTLDVNLQYGADLDVGYQDVLASIERAEERLPDDIDKPFAFKADPTQLPVLELVISSEEMDPVELRDWAEDVLEDELVAVPGVAGTDIAGGLAREFRVHLYPESLAKHNLTLDSIRRKLIDENIELYAGRVYEDGREVTARTTAEYRDIEEIRRVVVAEDDGAVLRLSDVAQVEDSHEEIRLLTRLNGRDCVRISVYKQADANTVQVARQVGERVEQLRQVLPADIEMRIMDDQAVYVESEIRGVRDAGLGAAILVIIVIYFFLGSLRQVAIMLVALGSTLALNFALMHMAGFSINVFSLGGLVIAMGVVVDHSIVVVENITRMLRQSPDTPPERAAVDGSSEVGPALVAATASLLALFAPIYMVPAVASLLFRELVAVIAGVVIISLGVAVIVTPMLSAILIGGSDSGKKSKVSKFQIFFDEITDYYSRILSRLLAGRWLVLIAFVIPLALALMFAPRLGTEFLPSVDDGRPSIMINMPIGAAVSETDQAARQVEDILSEMDEIETYFSLVGGVVRGVRTQEQSHTGIIDIQLVPRGERDFTTLEFIEILRPALRPVFAPGGRLMVRPPKIRGMRDRGAGQLDILVRGSDLEVLNDIAGQVQRLMSDVPGLVNVQLEQDESKPEYRIEIDRTRAADLGLSASDISSTLAAYMHGVVASRFREGDRYYDIRIRMPEGTITSRRELENITLEIPGENGRIPLADVATVKPFDGPVEIVRENQVKQVVVSGDIGEGTLGQTLSDTREALAPIDIPPGYEISYGGQAQEMAETARALATIFGFALFFSFVVLAVQFNSLRLPAIVLGSVPFSIAGMVFILYATGIPAGSTVIIGVLVVLAATINDGVLLMTYAEDCRTDGRAPKDAALEAGVVRLRPRIMTTLTTMAGFAMLAAKISEGGDLLQPMAVAAIGGLAAEMLVALFLMPALYVILTPERRFS